MCVHKALGKIPATSEAGVFIVIVNAIKAQYDDSVYGYRMEKLRYKTKVFRIGSQTQRVRHDSKVS